MHGVRQIRISFAVFLGRSSGFGCSVAVDQAVRMVLQVPVAQVDVWAPVGNEAQLADVVVEAQGGTLGLGVHLDVPQ